MAIDKQKTVLVTGGLGYIGSHTVVELISSGFEVVILDDLSNAHEATLTSIYTLSNQKPHFFEGRIHDSTVLEKIFTLHKIWAVLHFAAYKSVNESVVEPLKYYENNVSGTITLLESMRRHKVHQFIFSSSATVYGEMNLPPFDETMPLSSNHAYGLSKIMVEQILEQSRDLFNYMSLRYFNPVGSHSSGKLRENSKSTPTNLMPIIAEVATGKREQISIFGTDYPTPDGTAIRDFIHVVDVARAHVDAVNYLIDGGNSTVVNIGTGQGYSVQQIVDMFERIHHITIPRVLAPRREGDIAISFANVAKAKEVLGFKTKYSLEEMVRDSL